MKNRKNIDEQALKQLEIAVEASQMADAKAVLGNIASGMWDRTEFTLWIDERKEFPSMFFPVEDTDLGAAMRLWDRVLGAFAHDKQQLLFLGQEIITSFGGIGKILDVDYDRHTKTLVWKIQFSTELSF